MITQSEITLPEHERGFHLITEQIISALPELPKTGLLNLFIKHTSAAITINENIDPSVRDDLEQSYNHVFREYEPFYTHTQEGPDDMPAHIKSSVTGVDVNIPISNGKLNLGMWQGIYLCEFRNRGGARNIIATCYS